MDVPEGTGGDVKDAGDEALSQEPSTVTNDVSETLVKKMENVVIIEKKRDVKDAGDEALSQEPSTVTNDVSETLVKKMENVVITEKKRAGRKSSKSSKLKSQAGAVNDSVKKVEYGDVCFPSSDIRDNEFDEVTPMNCAVSTQDASELIAKQLEDVVIAEKTSRKVKISKSPRSTLRRKPSSNKCNKMDFQSTIVIGDSSNVAPSVTPPVSPLYGTKQLVQRPEGLVYPKNEIEPIGDDASGNVSCSDEVAWEQKEVTQETVLKSSLKTSRSKVGNRSVKWADQRINEAVEDRKDTSDVMQEEDSDNSLRLASAEACAAALLCAAEAVASGEAEAGDAVVEAGITILPQPQHGDGRDSEADEEAFEFDRGVLKWPKKTVLLESDMFDVEDSWHDTPPEGFSLTLSTFARMWMVLFEWITCSSLAYIYGHDESSLEQFLVVNGREYPRKIFVGDGKSSEIRQALDGFICRALPALVMDLRLPTPVSTLEKFVARLLDTMSFVDALPSFKMKQWQVIVLLFMEGLSVHRLPYLAQQMTSRTMLVHTVLNAAQVSSEEYEIMRDLIMPLGRLPQFSMQSGG